MRAASYARHFRPAVSDDAPCRALRHIRRASRFTPDEARHLAPLATRRFGARVGYLPIGCRVDTGISFRDVAPPFTSMGAGRLYGQASPVIASHAQLAI